MSVIVPTIHAYHTSIEEIVPRFAVLSKESIEARKKEPARSDWEKSVDMLQAFLDAEDDESKMKMKLYEV